MNKLILVLCLFFFTGLLFSQNLSNEETKLYNIIMDYRAEKALSVIPLSKSLTFVAQTHVYDLVENQPHKNTKCNLHSWSNKGDWSSCCYTSDHAKAECMWVKPSELTSYKGNGYEIASESSENTTAKESFNGWKNSIHHNAVIVNSGIWKNSKWNSIGVGIYKGFAVVWFGVEVDTN